MKRQLVCGFTAAREIAKFLGLNPDEHPITEISLHANMNDAFKATVTVVATAEQLEALKKLLERYQPVCEVEAAYTMRSEEGQ